MTYERGRQMNKKQFQEFFETRHFRQEVQGNYTYAYGVLEGFPVAFLFTGSKSIGVTISVEPEDLKSRVQELKRDYKKFKFHGGKETISAVIRLGKQPEEEYRTETKELVYALRQKGIRPACTCKFCGQKGADALIPAGNCHTPVHRHCVDDLENKATIAAEENQNSGNYITGVIGALLGALVGVIPSVLTILLMERIYSLLFALIPLCIYWGYKLFKGKMNKAVIFISIILSVLSVYLIQIEVFMFTLMSEYSITLPQTMAFMTELLSEPAFWTEATIDSLSCFLFVGLGIWVAWSQIAKTNASALQEAQELKGRLTPYGEAAESGAYEASNYDSLSES